MTKTYAQVRGGVVVNTVVADDGNADLLARLTPPGGSLVDLTGHPGIGVGWLYDGETFTAPPLQVILPPHEVLVTSPNGTIYSVTISDSAVIGASVV